MSGEAPPATLPELHRTLRRQLRRLGLESPLPPDARRWAQLLDVVSGSYQEADDDRYLLERSMEVSSTEMEALHETLRHQAHVDPLTGLLNRAGLASRLDAAARGDRELGVVFIDLDGFKAVNDTRGHAVGDEVLVAVAERLRRCCRGEDLVARTGGDEFVVAATHHAGHDAVQHLAQRLMAAVDLRVERPGGGELSVTASVGFAVGEAGGLRDVEDLLRRADAAMYRAKLTGKHRVVDAGSE